MIDRKKVIKGLKCHQDPFGCPECPYWDREASLKDCDKDKLMADALTLLREQEPVKPTKSTAYEKLWLCGKCKGVVAIREPFTEDWYIACDYCPHCGREVDWGAKQGEDHQRP